VERSRGIWAWGEGAEEGLECVEEHAESATTLFCLEYVCEGGVVAEGFNADFSVQGTVQQDVTACVVCFVWRGV
jgi:hypothetical protein